MARMTKERFDKATERDMRNFFATLSEKDQRRYAAIQARQLGFGGMEYIAEVLGCSRRTISRGWKTFPICPMIRPRAGFDGQALVESDVSTRLAGPSPTHGKNESNPSSSLTCFSRSGTTCSFPKRDSNFSNGANDCDAAGRDMRRDRPSCQD